MNVALNTRLELDLCWRSTLPIVAPNLSSFVRIARSESEGSFNNTEVLHDQLITVGENVTMCGCKDCRSLSTHLHRRKDGFKAILGNVEDCNA